MSRAQGQLTLGGFARAGFLSLSEARASLLALGELAETDAATLLEAFALAGDPDAALARVTELVERHPGLLAGLDTDGWRRLCLLFGASTALGSFFARCPGRLRALLAGTGRVIDRDAARTEMLLAVGADPESVLPAATAQAEAGWVELRSRYRELLAELVLYDLVAGLRGDALEVFEEVAASLSHLADAALEAGLAVARTTLASGLSNGAPVVPERLDAVTLAIVAMGKCGAEELNVVSDVDVMFVAAAHADLNSDIAMRIATQLATETMRAVHDPASEPPLWQVDPNLRPEGRQGPLVRTLGSMLAYYERWAKAWEFQALLKARAAAGDLGLGAEFVAQTREMVWASGGREDFVGSVQRMRERVTEHINPDELDVQLKLDRKSVV